ncbi:MAG: DUF4377 domain-containing protein [Granulosicoccus sp.]
MRSITKRLIGATLSLVLLSSCSSTSGDGEGDRTLMQSRGGEVRMLINHHKAGCQGLYYQTCLLTRESEQDSWSYFFGPIEDFEFEWGYQYELRVRVTEIDDPPEDASSRHYSLVEQVQKTKVDAGSSFEFSLMPALGFTERLSATEFQLGQEVDFTCDVPTCDSVASLLTQDMAMLVIFQHAMDTTGRLRLQRILCSDAPLQFHESCLARK